MTTGVMAAGGKAAGLRSNWGWFIAAGVLLFLLGLYALANLMVATLASIWLYGLFLIVGGIAQIIHAFRAKSWGMTALWVLGGVLYALAGLVALIFPVLASVVYTLMLGILLIVLGVVRIITAFDARAGAQWGWIAFGGLLTLVLGVLIVLHWPATSLFVLGLFLGIDLIYQGIAWILFGIGVRRLA
jgi:uncharacterized membrane protein HdeD (DUF308 family)